MTDLATANGTTNGAHQHSYDTSNILEALQVIHNPTTKNEVRRQASEYLENLKLSNEALQYGCALASDKSQPPLVQHFGLSVLSHIVRHEVHHLSEQQMNQLRECINELGRSIRDTELVFIRNKIAELWIELAKRYWALDMFGLDEQLVYLWEQDLVRKDFVLTILENLSEDIFVRDDSVAIMRGRELNSALVEIFTSSSNFAGGIKIGDTTHHMRFGEDGWLSRITKFLEEAIQSPSVEGQLKEVVLKALATIRSAFTWVMTPAIVHSMALAVTCGCLTQADPDLIMAAMDSLLSLYGRVRLEELEVQALVHPLIQPDSIATFRQLYSWSIVSVDEMDSSKYVISKKLSELMSLFADHMCQYKPPEPSTLDLFPFLRFLTMVAEHESLIVSIPVVHSWVKILEVQSWRTTAAVSQCVGPLLEVASQRLMQYDQLPDDTREPVVVFVNEEIELFPERQGFYMNYRRLCSAVIEWICFAQLEDALQAVMNRVDALLNEIEAAEQHFDITSYERVSMHLLRADAYFAMVDAAFKGFDRWQDAHREGPSPEEDQLVQIMREETKAWVLNMMKNRHFKDPQIRQRQIKTVVEVSNRALRKDTGFAFSVLEHILSSFIIVRQQDSSYADAVEDLHSYATSELRRLSLQHADYFVTFYDQLQAKFSDLINQISASERLQVDLKSTLFSVIQHATGVDYTHRQAKLEEFLQPIAAAWADQNFQSALGSLESFAHFQGFDQIGPYLASLGAGKIEDWSAVPFDNRGVQIQNEMSSAYARLPLRATRIFLSISTERLEQGSQLHSMICDLWSPMVPTMLEYVLRLTSYNHQLHNPSSWPNVPPELEGVIRRVLRDRYWQSGISSGSMGEFHSRVKASRSTLEGFASSVRGKIRGYLEQCYSILHTLGRLGTTFYSMQQLPELIAQAAIDSAVPLSPHHFAVMLQMLPKLIDECPPGSRQHFLTPIISSVLVQMDIKLSTEWEKMNQRKQNKHDEENLSDEMRDDSVLRQTTYRAVNLVAHWLQPRREQELSSKKSIVNRNYLTDGTQQTMRDFLLSHVHLLEKLLVLINHALAFKDMKSSYQMLMTAHRLVPEFASDRFVSGDEAAAVREYISTDMLKTAITCLNDGYFADQQVYYAQLIATIWLSYGLPNHVPATETTPAHERPSLTPTPRDVILSLPGMTEAKVNHASTLLLKEASLGNRSKRLRAIILALLEGVRGVRVSELGKIDTRQQQSKILEKYKQREMLSMQGVEDGGRKVVGGGGGIGDDGADLAGVADMFGS
ncbi:putative Karyopherin [Fonsecaea pedrosoi]|nr:putative Karyopherin [Fonsecaea pedrosoi]